MRIVGPLHTAPLGALAALVAALLVLPATAPAQDARVEVSLSARQLSLYSGGERAATWSIAVGQPEWPTPTGEWHIHQIDINPDWTPPDSEWAEGSEYTEPGDPDNPMGRMRILYNPPYSIHGTDELESIGRAASHGSIRIANENGWELARRLMEASGDTRPESWWERVRGTPTEMFTVELTNPIPIRVRDE